MLAAKHCGSDTIKYETITVKNNINTKLTNNEQRPCKSRIKKNHF